MPEKLDELNRLFTSKNVEDVIKFYDHFDAPEQLIEWMKNRPSAPMKIYEVEGDKDIVVVIPTANHEGDMAKNCAKDIFKGQQIVFVESNGPFFNYARSCNYGLKYALKYNPKWIILSNDDIYKIDDISVLVKQLSNLNNINFDTVFIDPNPDYHHSDDSYVISYGFFDVTLLPLLYKFSKLKQILRKKYKILYGVTNFKNNKNRLRYLLSKKVSPFIGVGDFAIFSSVFLGIKNYKVFDEVFINGYEDIALSLELYHRNRYLNIDFKLGSHISSSLGRSDSQILRSISNAAYFSFCFKFLKNKIVH